MIIRDDMKKIFKRRALQLLARREHSYTELIYKLKMKGCPETTAKMIADDCVMKDYLNLQRFAESFSRNKAYQGYGPIKINAALRQHGISHAMIVQVLAMIDWQHARDIALRKIRHTDSLRIKQALYLRGFQSDAEYDENSDNL